MKHIITSVLLLTSFCGMAQFSAAAGIGMSDKADILSVKMQYEGKLFGASAGYIVHLDGSNPVYFNTQIMYLWYFGEVDRLVFHAGPAFAMSTSEEKTDKGFMAMAGTTYEARLGDRIIFAFDLSATKKHLFITIGLRGLLGKLKAECYQDIPY